MKRIFLALCGTLLLCLSGCTPPNETDKLLVFEDHLLSANEMESFLGSYTPVSSDRQPSESTLRLEQQGKEYVLSLEVTRQTQEGVEERLQVQGSFLLSRIPHTLWPATHLAPTWKDKHVHGGQMHEAIVFSSPALHLSSTDTDKKDETIRNVFFLVRRNGTEIHFWTVDHRASPAKGHLNPLRRKDPDGVLSPYIFKAEDVKVFLAQYADAYTLTNESSFIIDKRGSQSPSSIEASKAFSPGWSWSSQSQALRRLRTSLWFRDAETFGRMVITDNIRDLSTAPEVDEQLFLLRNLELLHSLWPTALSDRGEVARRLAALRHELVRVKEYAKAIGADDRITAMYDDTIKLADHYGELLMELGAIDRDFYRKAVKQSAEAGVDSFTGGFGLGAAMGAVEPMTATVVIGGFAIKQAVDAYQLQQQLEEQRVVALERRVNQYLVQRSQLLGTIEVQADVLADKLKWDAAEVGFDRDEKEAGQVLAAIEEQHFDLLFDRVQTLKTTRPRDPFVYAESAGFQAEAANLYAWDAPHSSARGMHLAAADDYVRAVQLLPAARLWDDLRAEYLLQAARNTSFLLYHYDLDQVEPRFAKLLVQTAGTEALTLANTALKFRPRDPDGRIRYTKAVTLARCGRFEDAINLLDTVGAVRGRDARFHYQKARFLSMAGRFKESMEHLTTAWRLGWRDVRLMQRHRDLRFLRQDRLSEFIQLIPPTWASGIEYGAVWNDVTVMNKSEYPFTNVVLKANWKGKDGAEYTEVYWTDSIGPGNTCRFQGALNRATRSNMSEDGFVRSIRTDELSGFDPAVGTHAVSGTYSGLATLMQSDGSNIHSTTKATLNVDMADDKLQLRFTNSGDTIQVVADELRQGAIRVESSVGTLQRIKVFFNAKVACGWCQTAADARDGNIRAFWLEK